MFTTIFYAIRWLFLGPFYLLFILMRDMVLLFRILNILEGCRTHFNLENELEEESEDEDMVVRCFNEARSTAIDYYLEIKKSILMSQ